MPKDYCLTQDPDLVLRVADGVRVNLSDPESHYARAYFAWLEEGGVPDPVLRDEWAAPMLSEFRAQREMMLNRITGIISVSSDAAVIDAGKSLRQGLLDLPDAPAVKAAADPEALRVAIRDAYQALVTPLPIAAKIAFAKVNA